jgi:hypothetical protein
MLVQYLNLRTKPTLTLEISPLSLLSALFSKVRNPIKSKTLSYSKGRVESRLESVGAKKSETQAKFHNCA